MSDDLNLRICISIESKLAYKQSVVSATTGQDTVAIIIKYTFVE